MSERVVQTSIADIVIAASETDVFEVWHSLTDDDGAKPVSEETQPTVKCPRCNSSMEGKASSYCEIDDYRCSECKLTNYAPEGYPVELINIIFKYQYEHEES